MEKVFLLDIGGTNVRYALAEKGKTSIEKTFKKNIKSESLDKLLEELLTNEGGKILNLVISAAGPKIGGVINMTNRSYEIDPIKIKEKFNLKECYLLNDWESIAYGHDYLNKQDCINLLNNGANPYNKNSLYFGPGTGLGVSFLLDDQIVIPSEYGNTNLGVEELIGKDLFKFHKFKSIEETLSGKAISTIYEIKTGKDLSAEEIFSQAKNDDLVANEILQEFIERLAIILSDLTLTFLPGRGVYLAGNLTRSLRDFINVDFFEKKFLSNKVGAHLELLRNTPIKIIMKEHSPLYGNLNYFNLSQKGLV